MSEKTKSTLILLLSMLIFGSVGIFRKNIPLSSGMLSFVRGIIGSLFLCAFVKIKGENIRNNIGKRNLILLIISGALMGINWMLLFEAYNYTTVSIATLCDYMEPTIVILVSPIFFKEKLTPKKLICAAVAFGGMYLVTGMPGLGTAQLDADNMKGVLLGLISAFTYASVVIMNKKIESPNAYEKSIIQLISASFMMVPYLILNGEFAQIFSGGFHIGSIGILLTLAVGILHTGIAYVLYFTGLKGLSSQRAAMLGYSDPVAAMILSAVFLGETMSGTGIIGAIMIIGASIYGF